MCDEPVPIRNDRKMSELVTFFGQFLDHTVTFVPVNGEEEPNPEPLHIEIPAGDLIFTEPSSYIPFFCSVRRRRAPFNELTS